MWAAPAQRTLPVVLSTVATSAVVVRVPLPRALARLRARWDWAASVGVPPHVTIVFPFLPVDELTPDVRRTLVAIAAGHRPFDVRFARVERFPTVVYLAPEPSAPFTRLTEAVVDRFPDFPPYGGAFEEVIPHLTITESGDAAVRRHRRPGGGRPPLLAPGHPARCPGRSRRGPLARPLAHPPRGQTVMSSRCSPQATRRRSLISPTVA